LQLKEIAGQLHLMPFIIEHIQGSVSLIYMLELKEIASQLLSDSYVLLDRNPGTRV
jgi:hypothetical protein